MKEIKAIVQPFMVQKIVDALQDIPRLPGVTVSEVRGFGRTRGKDITGEALVDGSVAYAQKSKLEIVVDDDQVTEVISIIVDHARTGNLGDGKIFVSSVEEVVRIRTGERGNIAL